METIVQQDFYDKGLHEIHDDVHFIVGAVRMLEECLEVFDETKS